ncbi:hypothetical protein Tco_0298595 [Tanacetum coccineum]
MNMALVLMAKAFKLNYSTNQQQPEIFNYYPSYRRIASTGYEYGSRQTDADVELMWEISFRQYAGRMNQGVQNIGNQNGQIVVSRIFTNQNPNGNGIGSSCRNCTVRTKGGRDVLILQTQLVDLLKRIEAGIHSKLRALI